jgi:roadblock/LC7 domain-containing protein
MATRFYLTRQSYTVINPGTLGTWGSSVKSIYKLAQTGDTADGAYLNSTYTGYGAGTVLFRQYISPEMSAGIVFNGSTTYELCIRMSESSTAANAYGQWALGIVSEDGTTSYFSPLTTKDSTEMATSLTARSNTITGGISYTTVAGDHLVLEVGWDQDAATGYSIVMSNGFLETTDLSGDGDTGTDDPWFETSNTITFGGGDPAPPATNEDYDVSAYISGVLDEWV